MEHAVFNATVIASRSEQDAAGINPGELKQLPMALPGRLCCQWARQSHLHRS